MSHACVIHNRAVQNATFFLTAFIVLFVRICIFNVSLTTQ